MTGAYNLGKVERVAADCVEDQILQLVDGGEQVLAKGSHGNGRGSVQLRRHDDSKRTARGRLNKTRENLAPERLWSRSSDGHGPEHGYASRQAVEDCAARRHEFDQNLRSKEPD